jgi:hypothetical protein
VRDVNQELDRNKTAKGLLGSEWARSISSSESVRTKVKVEANELVDRGLKRVLKSDTKFIKERMGQGANKWTEVLVDVGLLSQSKTKSV